MHSSSKEFVEHWQNIYPDEALRPVDGKAPTEYEQAQHLARIELLEEMMDAVSGQEHDGVPDELKPD